MVTSFCGTPKLKLTCISISTSGVGCLGYLPSDYLYTCRNFWGLPCHQPSYSHTNCVAFYSPYLKCTDCNHPKNLFMYIFIALYHHPCIAYKLIKKASDEFLYLKDRLLNRHVISRKIEHTSRLKTCIFDSHFIGWCTCMKMIIGILQKQEKCLMALWTGFPVQFWNRLLTDRNKGIFSLKKSKWVSRGQSLSFSKMRKCAKCGIKIFKIVFEIEFYCYLFDLLTPPRPLGDPFGGNFNCMIFY